MKITIVSPAFPFRGGISHFAGALYKELSKGHDVNITTFKRQYPSFFFPGKSQTAPDDLTQKIPSISKIDSINPFNWIKVGNEIRNDAPDLLIFNFWLPFFGPCYGKIARKVKQNNKTKIVSICHNVLPHEKRIGDKFLTKYFFKSVEYFILLSKKVEEDLLNIKPDAKFKTLFHPIYNVFGETVEKDFAKGKLGIKKERIILFFGLVREYKGLDTALEAMAKLKDKIDATLVVAGEFYSDREKYEKMISDLGLTENVILHDEFIPTDQVSLYFSAADVVLLPYRDATQSGIVQIATNFNKPIIATNVGGMEEIVKDEFNGFVVEKENPTVMSQAIQKFYLENKEEMFTNNMRIVGEKYSWEKFSNGLFELIET